MQWHVLCNWGQSEVLGGGGAQMEKIQTICCLITLYHQSKVLLVTKKYKNLINGLMAGVNIS